MTSSATYCIGSVISVDCTDESCIQGRLAAVDRTTNSITIERAFKNGHPLNEKLLSLPIVNIKNVKILKLNSQSSSSNATSCKTNNEVPQLSSKDTKKDDQNALKNKKLPNAVNASKQMIHQCAPSSSRLHSNSSSPVAVPSNGSRSDVKSKSATISHAANSHHRNANVVIPKPWTRSSASMSPVAHSGPRRYYDRGPCGIPELDMMNDNMHVKRGNRHLNRPINFDILNTDFDFEANLALFDKDNLKGELEDGSVERRRRLSQNYKHYENVISDPSRVTSWTNANGTTNNYSSNNQMNKYSVRFDRTADGIFFPFLNSSDKKKYLKAGEKALGCDTYNAMIADRLFMFFCSVVERFKIESVNQIVVIAAKNSNEVLVNALVRSFINRQYGVILYDHYLPLKSPHIHLINDNIDKLPITDAQLVIILDDVVPNGLLINWFKKLPKTTHLISLEVRRHLCRYEHILMIGVGSEESSRIDSSLNSATAISSMMMMMNNANKKTTNNLNNNNNNNNSFSKNNNLIAVTDIGIPFNFIDPSTSSCLADAFSTSVFVLF